MPLAYNHAYQTPEHIISSPLSPFNFFHIWALTLLPDVNNAVVLNVNKLQICKFEIIPLETAVQDWR